MKKFLGICGFLLLVVAGSAQNRGAEMDSVLRAKPVFLREARAPGIRLRLRGVYVLHGVLWFSLQLRNGSVIDWRGSPMRFSIRDRRVWKRRARQELPLPVIAKREPLVVRADSGAVFCYGLLPRLPGKGQDLVLECGERNGDRRMSLRLDMKAILKAKKLD